MKINNSKEIGEWVENTRKSMHINQTELAKLSHVSKQSICSIEGNYRSPSVDTLIALTSALGYKVVILSNAESEVADKEYMHGLEVGIRATKNMTVDKLRDMYKEDRLSLKQMSEILGELE